MNSDNPDALSVRSFLSLSMLAIFLGTIGLATAFAQDRYAIERARTAVREQILREQGVSTAAVSFPTNMRADTYFISNAQTGVRGQGIYTRDNYSGPRTFSYEAVVNIRNGRVDRISYQLETDSQTGNVPSWLVGAFRGRHPVSRERMTVTIYPSGQTAAVYENGGQDSGTVYGSTIRFGAVTWDVTQADNGFRARGNGRTERFDRVSDGGSGGGGSNDPCAVPRWMVGRFRGMTNSGESELVINSNGSATARSLTTNRAFSGRYSEGFLTFDFGSYGIARERDGIRTLAVNNPSEQTAYARVGPEPR
ncbi:MAG: hypothetical protein ACREBG_14195 [Pyrinomonadaceae bacterium]